MSLSGRRLALATASAFLLATSIASAAPQAKWQRAPQLPAPRTEVAAAAYKGGVVVIGGFAANGSASNRVDLYQPGKRKWRRLPNLPVVVNHAMAATAAGKLYVVGGYAEGIGLPRRDAFVFDGVRWSRLPTMPDGRAAAAAAVAGGKLYVVGGISLGAADLAREALCSTWRWANGRR